MPQSSGVVPQHHFSVPTSGKAQVFVRLKIGRP